MYDNKFINIVDYLLISYELSFIFHNFILFVFIQQIIHTISQFPVNFTSEKIINFIYKY